MANFMASQRGGVVLLFLLVAWLHGCTTATTPQNGDQPLVENPGITLAAQVTGRVTDGNGQGVAGVTVANGTLRSVTDADGYYVLPRQVLRSLTPLPILFTKAGYATNQEVLPVATSRESYSVDVTMIPYQFVGVISADSTTTSTVAMPDPDAPGGAPVIDISIPPGAIPASGPITVSVVRGDPTVSAGRAIFPGEYIGTGSSDPADNTMLESIAFTEITLTDIQGNEISQLDKPVTITVKLPTALQGSYQAGDTIPWWSYDEATGAWVREDADLSTPAVDDALIIEQNGVLFGVAQVIHFSWWNIDQPISSHACLCAEVVDEASQALTGVPLVGDGVTYNGRSKPVLTDTQGKACVTVKRSLDSASREKIKLNVEYSGSTFSYAAADAAEGETTGSPVIKTPTEHGSMLLENPGVCLSVKNPIRLDNSGEISGQILDGSGNPMANLEFFMQGGKSIITDAAGRFSINAPVGISLVLYKPGLFTQSVVVGADTKVADVTINLPNKAPWLQLFESDINRTLSAAETATLTATAVDPEDGELTYEWALSGGAGVSLSGTGSSATFTAPASGSGSGSALVTVTITDDKGSTTQGSMHVTWGSAGEQYNLKLMMFDNARDNTPMEGVVVMLHDAVSGAITRRITSDAMGVADFGYIGTSRATLSVLYHHPATDCTKFWGGNHFLNTYVDVPVRSMAYYVEQFITAIPTYEMSSDCPVTTNVATYDLTLNQIPMSAYNGTTLFGYGSSPFFTFTLPLSGSGSEVSITSNIGDWRLHSGNRLDLFAVMRNGQGEPVTLGALLNQQITPGQHHPLAMTMQAPQAIPLTIDFPALAQNVTSVSAYIDFPWPTVESNSLFLGNPPVSSGSGVVPAIPEVENYSLYFALLGYGGGVGELWGSRRYKNSDSAVVINTPTLSAMQTSPVLQNNTFAWTGEQRHDFTTMSMNFTCDDNYTSGVVWSVLLDSSASQWKVVEPPAELSQCLSIRDQIGDYWGKGWSQYSELTFVDLDITQSRDDLWTLLGNGVDVSKSWRQRNEVYYSISAPDVP